MAQQMHYEIRVFKQYFNFSASHFMTFSNGTREPLHGHNYRIEVSGKKNELSSDMVFDFLDLKPIVRAACNELDHRFLLPTKNPHLRIQENELSYTITALDESQFMFPKNDCKLIPIENTSVERIGTYLIQRIQTLIWEKFHFEFEDLSLEIEESPGQSAIIKFAQ